MRVVTFATYPAENPRHGGQIRLAAIHQRFLEQDCEVDHLCVVQHGAFPDATETPWMFRLPPRLSAHLCRPGKRPDVHACELFERREECLETASALILDASPDVLILEQPWLWPLVRKLRQSHARIANIPIVYSSQNVEYLLLKEEAVNAKQREVAHEAEMLERDLVQTAQLVIAVTQSDARCYEEMQAASVAVCRNGTYVLPTHVDVPLPEAPLDKRRFATFVSSAHPPNATGFLRFLCPAGFLPPDTSIAVVGGVGNIIQRSNQFREFGAVNRARMHFTGECALPRLRRCLRHCEVILLPIVAGGGSNIKTAEALLTGKRVLATSRAMRGFEDFMDFPTLTVEDKPARFRDHLLAILRTPQKQVELTPEEHKALNSLTWPQTLKAYVDLTRKIIAG